MTRIVSVQNAEFDMTFPVVVVGAGGTGLCGALAAHDAGADVLVLERDKSPAGSTGMSTGMIPAAGTLEQAAADIADSPERFVEDIMAKVKGRTDRAFAELLARESAETVRWLRDDHGVPLSLMDDWLYPGHSAKRMYGTPNRSGGELMGALERAVGDAGIPVLTECVVECLYQYGDRIVGVGAQRPGGETESIGCGSLVLACSGFGGNPDLVGRLIPEMAGAIYHGHPGNRGDALEWGEAIGAELSDLSAYQGHGGLAVGHGVPILWPTITEGGFQVNLDGVRFSNEASGYSEQAALVNAQPRRLAWTIFDQRCHDLMCNFDDYREALRAGAVLEAEDEAALASRTGIDANALAQTMEQVRRAARGEIADTWGRDFSGRPELKAPYFAARVTGALFHTQGGLGVDEHARVRRANGGVFPNLYAGGGAARGISGDGASGYLAGNGLLTATTLGRLAGAHAGAQHARAGS